MGQTVTLELDLVNATLAYLGEQPLKDVLHIFSGLKQQAEASLQAQQASGANELTSDEVQPETKAKPEAEAKPKGPRAI